MKTATNAEEYFRKRHEDPGYATAFARSQRRIAAIDAVVSTLDEYRMKQGLSKAELARQAGLPPEAVRRLFSVSHRNPTLKTIVAIADALQIGVVVGPVPDLTANGQ